MPPKKSNPAADASDGNEARLERLDTARLTVLCVTIVAAALAYSFSMVSFLHAKEAVLCAALLVQGVLYALRRPPIHAMAPALALALLGMWLICITVLAGNRSLPALAGTQRFFLVVLSGLVVSDLVPRHGRAICAALVFSGGAVALLACLQYMGWIPFLFPVFSGYDQAAYSVFGNQDLLGGYLAVTLALGAAMALRHTIGLSHLPALLVWPIRLCLPVIAAGLYISLSRSAWLAAAVGVAVAVPWRAAWAHIQTGLRRRTVAVVTVVLLACMIPAVWLAPTIGQRVTRTFSGADVGYRARLWMWDGAVEMVRENPLTGVGFCNYALQSPYYLGKVLWKPGGERHYRNELHADTAHSEPLQFAAENGITGMAVLLGVMLLFGLKSRKGELPLLPVCRPLPGAWGALAALGVVALLNATLHSAPHALAGLLLLCGQPGPCRPHRLGRAAAWAVPALCLLFLWPHVQNTLIPSRLLRAAETAHVNRRPEAEALYRRAIAWSGFSTQAHEDYAILLSDQGRNEEALRQLDLANPGLDTGRVHLLRAACAQSLGRKKLAFSAASQCLYRWPESAQAWDILMKNCPPDQLDAWKQRWARWMGKAAASSGTADAAAPPL
jgi:O-antigen ligase